MTRRIPPPDGAELITGPDCDDPLGWIKLHEPAPGRAVLAGFDVYRYGGPNVAIPYRNVPSRGDAITELKNARYRPRPDPSLDWRVGDK
jgi:hypothetical protein